MRIAVLADVHGDRHALEAVLADIGRSRVDAVVDLVSGPFDPRGSADLRMGLGAATVRGNHDRHVLGDPRGADDSFAAPALAAPHRAWLAGLPPTSSLAKGDVFACHGSPAGSDLLDDVSAGRPNAPRRKPSGTGFTGSERPAWCSAATPTRRGS